MTSTVTGPVIDGNKYTFTRIYILSAPNATADPVLETYVFLWDPNPPVLIGVPGDIQLSCGAALPPWPPVTAVDPEIGPVIVTRTTVTIPTTCGDIVKRTWRAEDDCGNVATATQTITFIDDTPPDLQVPEDLTLECGDPIPAPSYTASDDCSTFTVEFTETTTEQNECEYTLVRIWAVFDACGNVARDTQIITVIDGIAPVITVLNPDLVGLPLGGELIMYWVRKTPGYEQ